MIGLLSGFSAASSFLSGVSGFKSSRKASESAMNTAKYNANLIKQQTAEQVRRAQMQQDQLLGESRAAIGGSGVTNSGSPAQYLQAIETEGSRQIDWMEKSGSMQADLAIRQGKQAANAYDAQGTMGLISGIGGAVSQLGLGN